VGPVNDAILAEEPHADQSTNHKIYAPGRGESDRQRRRPEALGDAMRALTTA
jgi:hypothetical protein